MGRWGLLCRAPASEAANIFMCSTSQPPAPAPAPAPPCTSLSARQCPGAAPPHTADRRCALGHPNARVCRHALARGFVHGLGVGGIALAQLGAFLIHRPCGDLFRSAGAFGALFQAVLVLAFALGAPLSLGHGGLLGDNHTPASLGARSGLLVGAARWSR